MVGVIFCDLDGEILYEVVYFFMFGYWGQGYGIEMV